MASVASLDNAYKDESNTTRSAVVVEDVDRSSDLLIWDAIAL